MVSPHLCMSKYVCLMLGPLDGRMRVMFAVHILFSNTVR